MFGDLSDFGAAIKGAVGEAVHAGGVLLGGIIAKAGGEIAEKGKDIARTQAGALPTSTRAKLAAALGGSGTMLLLGVAVGGILIYMVGRK